MPDNSPTGIDLDRMHDAVIAAVRAKFPAFNDVGDYTRISKSANPPSCFIQLTDAQPAAALRQPTQTTTQICSALSRCPWVRLLAAVAAALLWLTAAVAPWAAAAARRCPPWHASRGSAS